MLDQAFEALKTYDWGIDRKVLKPIDDAVVATHGKDEERKQLEERLTTTLKSEMSYDAKQFVCRKLMTIGTAASVPALAALLFDEQLSHMARYALERIPGPEAARALTEAMNSLNGKLKIGMISSLGVRQDATIVPQLGELLADSDVSVARAAAYGLAAIGSSTAASALSGKSADGAKAAVADAKLTCAEALLAQGDKKAALGIYRSLIANQPKHVKLAATRGVLACAGAK